MFRKYICVVAAITCIVAKSNFIIFDHFGIFNGENTLYFKNCSKNGPVLEKKYLFFPLLGWGLDLKVEKSIFLTLPLFSKQ